FSNNIGFSSFSGSAVRFRFYSSLGLSTEEIVKIITFCLFTFWVGLFVSAGIAFVVEPLSVPEILKLPFNSLTPLGILFLALILLYIVLVIFLKNPLKIKDWQFSLPSLPVSLLQIIIGFIDWIIAAFVIYVLFPHTNINFFEFFTIFMLAQISGLISNIPGGLGVFETVMVLFLSSKISSLEIFSVMIIYRTIYYIIPFIFGIILFFIHEILLIKDRFGHIFKTFGRWFPEIFPVILSIIIFLGGIVLIISGVSPAESLRMKWLDFIFPIHVIEISHFMASLIGILLLINSYAIYKRVDASYYLTIVLLLLGIVFSILKGLDYEEAIVLSVILFALIPCKNYFYRKSSIFAQVFSPLWFFLVLIVIICSIWIGLFYYKHIQYSHQLWWQFEFSNDASRFMRASFGVILIMIIFFISRLFSISSPKPHIAPKGEIELAKMIIRDSSSTYGNLALLGDKMLMFNEKASSFLMYGISGNTWISMGDPIGDRKSLTDLIWQFKETAYKNGGLPVFYEIGKDNIAAYIELGFTLFKYGEEALVDLESFSLDGKKNYQFRYSLNKLNKEGYKFEIIGKNEFAKYFEKIKFISDKWLDGKKTREKKFSLGYFDQEYLSNFDFAVIKKDEEIIAFSNIWYSSNNKEELSIDLMRYLPNYSNGVMDYLFTNIIVYAKSQGYKYFNLGMAPLSGLTVSTFAPLWNKIGNFIFKSGENFYNFQGLRNYKNKFNPEWHPKYIALTGGFKLPFILMDIASLISGGMRGVVLK
ncbi:MAG TPA: bifunctional lysylphosphatidylglycerol flippase/synthetase MprF, partial [Spirochaetota bacterium]|nr:bifunctional lysylphosphatidylglycerol flippase/synthetase MprF [Spirochaetota bacterium]